MSAGPCASAHDDPVPPAVIVGILHTSGYGTGPLVYPDTPYCQECADVIGDELTDRRPAPDLAASAPDPTADVASTTDGGCRG